MILTADDLKTGDFITVHRGKREQCPCGCGSCGPEPYERLKGLPLAVLGIQLPYVAAAVIPVGIHAVLDVRDCELMRLEPAYVACFPGVHQKPQQEQEPTANGPT